MNERLAKLIAQEAVAAAIETLVQEGLLQNVPQRNRELVNAIADAAAITLPKYEATVREMASVGWVEWESVYTPRATDPKRQERSALQRLAVPGGWLYMNHLSPAMTFVPDPEARPRQRRVPAIINNPPKKT